MPPSSTKSPIEAVPFEPVGELDSATLNAQHPEQVVGQVLERAVAGHASDVFFLSDQDGLTASMRQWGMVRPIAKMSREKGKHCISVIKAQAGMDIAEKRRPLDGRWIQRVANQDVDLRINVIPTLFGEDLTLRILSRETKLIELGELGMTQRNINEVRGILESPSGLILVSGPTGTGKTTTLYTLLRMLNNGRRKLNTIEDPVEYSIPGIRQSQVNPKIGVDFADLLRSILRQAPDVIMIGEIRDAETAITSVRAANSGHLVLATLHAPIAAGAIQSLLALGVHPHFLSTSLLGIIAQRLVRKLCSNCRQEFDLSESPETFSEIRSLLAEGQGKMMYGPQGCERCYGEGYRDRTGVFEVMTFDRTLRHMIAEQKPPREIEKKAIEQGMIEFHRSALLKVAQGLTSTEEVLRSVPVEYLGID